MNYLIIITHFIREIKSNVDHVQDGQMWNCLKTVIIRFFSIFLLKKKIYHKVVFYLILSI